MLMFMFMGLWVLFFHVLSYFIFYFIYPLSNDLRFIFNNPALHKQNM